MEPIPEEPSELTVEITTALIPEVPPLKCHDGPLKFISKPQILQKDYEMRILGRA